MLLKAARTAPSTGECLAEEMKISLENLLVKIAVRL